MKESLSGVCALLTVFWLPSNKSISLNTPPYQ